MDIVPTADDVADGDVASGRRPPAPRLPPAARKRADGENFPVALGVLPARRRRALLALYDFARYVDDIGDEFDGDRVSALGYLADQVRLLYDDGRSEVPAVAGLALLRDPYQVPAKPFLHLIEANVVDQHRRRYATFEDLVAYCELSANPIGRVVLRIFGVHGDRVEALSDRICTGLQLVEHLKDLGEDYRVGRIYTPQGDMRRFGVSEEALGAPSASAEVRALVRYETDRGLAYLESGARLVSLLHGWARVAVGGYVAGGRAAAAAIRTAGYDVLASDCSPSKRAVAMSYLRKRVWAPR